MVYACPHTSLQLLVRIDALLCQIDKRFSRFGKVDFLSSRTLEKFHAEFLFQRTYGIAQALLRDVELLRCSGKGACPYHFEKIL